MKRVVICFLALTGIKAQNVSECSSFSDECTLERSKRQAPVAVGNDAAYECMNLHCLCPYFGGSIGADSQCILPSGRPLTRAVRKELRVLTQNERTRLFNAFVQLKQRGEYDRLSRIHKKVAKDSGAHFGPAFLLWHREFLKRVEIALRLIDPGVAIPYWDSVMDGRLPDPRDSIMWSSLFVGDTDSSGRVVNGPFASFDTLEGNSNIVRILGQEGHLFTEKNIRDVLAQNSIENVLTATAPRRGCPIPPYLGAMEYKHASVHLWIGGDMKPPRTAANDPIFFFHHAFVDLVYELWRQMKQDRFRREMEFPQENSACSDPKHFGTSIMQPFRKTNIDGLSNAYTDLMYTYAPHPKCSASSPTCGSPFLFCDVRARPAHCVVKIKRGGRCDGFEGFESCFEGVCVDSICQPGVFQRARSVMRNEDCLNDEPCCGLRARRGECSTNLGYMQQYCRRSCGICSTADTGDNDCIDRHQMCPGWSATDQCTRRQQWMAENCRPSCGWCHLSTEQLCAETFGSG